MFRSYRDLRDLGAARSSRWPKPKSYLDLDNSSNFWLRFVPANSITVFADYAATHTHTHTHTQALILVHTYTLEHALTHPLTCTRTRARTDTHLLTTSLLSYLSLFEVTQEPECSRFQPGSMVKISSRFTASIAPSAKPSPYNFSIATGVQHFKRFYLNLQRAKIVLHQLASFLDFQLNSLK